MPTLQNLQGASLAPDPYALTSGIQQGYQMAAMGQQRKRQEEIDARNAALSNRISTLTPEAIAGSQDALVQIAQLDPQAAGRLSTIIRNNDEVSADKMAVESDRLGALAASAIRSDSPQIQKQIMLVEAAERAKAGDKAGQEEALRLAQLVTTDQEAFLNEMNQDVLLASKSKQFLDFIGMGKDKAKGFEQARGNALQGYVFNKDTGEFAINPNLERQLQESATRLSGKDQLSAKDISGVNDKITALTKDVRGVNEAAISLEALKENDSSASQIAAVFKFMKSLDPTSTVRESELGMIYSAEGAAQGLANQINKLMGEGGLSKEGFTDLVNTSKALADAAVETSNVAVARYLDVIKDNMTPKQYSALKERVPKKFGQPKNITVPY